MAFNKGYTRDIWPHEYLGDRTTVPPEACRLCGSHWSAPFHSVKTTKKESAPDGQ